MPVYLFTIHSYRSWTPDDSRGYVRRKQGIQEPDDGMARAYADAATEEPYLLDELAQSILCWIIYDCCGRRKWRLHGVAFEPTHVHILVSWKNESAMPEVFKRLINLMSWALGQKVVVKRKHWFSKFGSRQQVKDRGHFDHLMGVYLPKHGGLVWREGDDPPCEPTTSVDG